MNDELNRQLGEAYGIDISNIKPLDNKEIPRAFKVTTANQVYVLRLFKDRDREKLDSDIAVLKYLEANDFPASRIKSTIKGEDIFSYNEQFGIVTSYIDGKHPELNAETIEKIGVLMAQLHSLPISSEIPNSIWNVIDGRNSINQNIQNLSGEKIDHWDEIIPQLKQAFDGLPDLINLPKVLIHTDIGPNNSIESPDGKLSLIDWDDGGLGQSVIDIGNVLSQVLISFKDKKSLEPIFDQELARAFFKGYQSVRQLSEEEKQSIIVGMEFAALSYVLLEWIPKIALQNWERYKFVRENKELILSLI